MPASSWSALGAAKARLRFLRGLRPSFDAPALRGLTPGVLAIAFVPFLWPLVRLEMHEPLFSDTLVFQYQAWCIRHGLHLYRDVGTADGPFINYLQAAIQVFSGLSDHGFRKADLVFQGAGGAAIGAIVAPAIDPRRSVRWLHRLAWAAAAGSLWLAWYLTIEWEGTTQREGFYAVFGSLGLVLAYTSGRQSRSWSTAAIVASAALATTQVFGKPTGVMYPALAALTVLMPNAGATVPWMARLRLFAIGVGVTLAIVVITLLVSGSISGYLLWCVRIPYRGNAFLFRMDWRAYVWTTYWDPFKRMTGCAFIGGIAAIGAGILPGRALALTLFPPLAMLSACLQARGYNYHATPAYAAVHVLFLVIVAALWEQPEGRPWSEGRQWAAAVALSFLGYYGFCNLQESHYRWDGHPETWTAPKPYLEGDRDVGRYLNLHTKPDDWVFVYNPLGNSHVVLLAAERRTASPFFHRYWLDPVGLLSAPESKMQPTPAELEALTKLQKDIRAMACAAVIDHRPAAIAFTTLDQGFEECSLLRRSLARDFREVTIINSHHIYLRKN
jgi:hypothetical protein